MAASEQARFEYSNPEMRLKESQFNSPLFAHLNAPQFVSVGALQLSRSDRSHWLPAARAGGLSETQLAFPAALGLNPTLLIRSPSSTSGRHAETKIGAPAGLEPVCSQPACVEACSGVEGC